MNPVAEDRDAGHRRSRDDQELVRDACKILEHEYRRIAGGVQKNYLAAHLVDGDEASRTRQCCFHYLTRSPPHWRGRWGSNRLSSSAWQEGGTRAFRPVRRKGFLTVSL